ncbi:hypothetical protein [Kribbella caucasensis]|uniref:hypothetical protein n=1 Tax=Kribbella caucasensis TaxID=2512215 RepID=UPI001EDD4E14|nr:hypothetical protein [Kribbella sp. VKM Ac-2527]
MSKNCAICGDPFEAARSDRRYCSAACRKSAWRGAPAIEQPAELPGPVARETRVILGRLDVDLDRDHVGRAALRCAAALDDPNTPPGALVGLSRALPEALEYLREVRRTELS